MVALAVDRDFRRPERHRAPNRRRQPGNPHAAPVGDNGNCSRRQRRSAAGGVGADERYTLGWFNLGVVLARMGAASLLQSQGALARAIMLYIALRDRVARTSSRETS